MKLYRKSGARLLGCLAGTVIMAMSLCANADVLVANACVVVFDATAPSLTPNGDMAISIEAGSAYTDPGASATDNMDGDVSGKIVVAGNVNTAVPGQYTVTYTVSDSIGNTSESVMRTVTVVDTTKPTLTLNGNAAVTVEALSSYSDAGASATDSVDGNITARIVTVNNVDTKKIGTYSVTYNVSDAAGNAADPVVRSVKVVDTTPPVITIK